LVEQYLVLCVCCFPSHQVVKSKITRERIITVEAAKCDHLQIDSADNINLLITISE
jgi:hypothetical protein